MGCTRTMTPRPWWHHAAVAVMLGIIVWSTVEQQWVVSVASLNVLALIALLMARGSRGDHLQPSLWLIGGMTVVLALPPIAVCLHHLSWITVSAAAVSSIPRTTAGIKAPDNDIIRSASHVFYGYFGR